MRSPIHDVVRTGLGQQLIEDVDLVHLAVADVDEGRDAAAQVEQRVQVDRSLVERKGAHGNADRHRSMVVVSSASTEFFRSTPNGSSAYV